MSRIRGLYKVVSLVGVGAVSGAGFAYYSGLPQEARASAAPKSSYQIDETTGGQNFYPEPVNFLSIPWNSNWDRKESTKSLKKKDKAAIPVDSSGDSTVALNADIKKSSDDVESREKKKPTASRHLFLVRHGQYHLKQNRDEDKKLTELGRQQAVKTGERLSKLNVNFDKIIHSNMTRAIETANLISESIPNVPMTMCSMLREGAPCRPEPPSSSNWKVEDWEFYQESSRIEAAFRKYFHRADVTQEKDSYELLVCHGNVIRYFACRALQFPPDGWLRMSIGHCGITWITIRPSGRVSLKSLGDTGHLPPDLLTFS